MFVKKTKKKVDNAFRQTLFLRAAEPSWITELEGDELHENIRKALIQVNCRTVCPLRAKRINSRGSVFNSDKKKFFANRYHCIQKPGGIPKKN